MSDAWTPTRQMAQSAAQKAQDAYATARQAMERVGTLEARIAALEAENGVLADRLERMDERPAPVSRRKAA